MNRLILLLLLIFMVAFAQETNKEKFFRLHKEIQSYTYDLDKLFNAHENGFPNIITLSTGQTLDFSVTPTGQQKVQLRNLMKATVDSIKVKADSLRGIFP